MKNKNTGIDPKTPYRLSYT